MMHWKLLGLAALLIACGPKDPSECGDDEVRVGEKCVARQNTNDVTTGSATCQDACEKRLNVCGFHEFDDDVGKCVSTCEETPAGERNIACYLDATCVEITEMACTATASEQYDAYRGAGGPACGVDANDYYVYCEPHDDCVSPVDLACAPGSSTSAYQAYRDAGGPACGVDANDYFVYCEAGDSCITSGDLECGPPADTYDAYRGAGGPACGVDANDYYVYCEPRDSCADESTSQCSGG